MVINVKKKGNSFELKIANHLSRITGKKWYRTPHSGMLNTIQDHQKVFRGDVYSESFPTISVECKAVKDFNMLEIFSKKSKFWKWVEQARNEAQKDDFLLYIKVNYQGVYVLSNNAVVLRNLKYLNDNEIRINAYYTMLKICPD